jgi:hypothetical protein
MTAGLTKGVRTCANKSYSIRESACAERDKGECWMTIERCKAETTGACKCLSCVPLGRFSLLVNIYSYYVLVQLPGRILLFALLIVFPPFDLFQDTS